MEGATRRYETVVVFSPELGESAVKDECKKIEQLISGAGGREIGVNPWGKKEMTYRVKGSRLGNFVAMNFVSENFGVVDVISKSLRISEPVVKFQTHLMSDRKRKFQGNPKRKSSGDSDDFGGGDSDF